MALKLELKAGERLRLGDCVVVNQGGRACLLIEGDAPVLRERDVAVPGRSDSPAKRLYLAMQSMYLSGRRGRPGGDVARLASEVLARAPEQREQLQAIEELVAAGRFYPAMRAARRLVEAGGERIEAT